MVIDTSFFPDEFEYMRRRDADGLAAIVERNENNLPTADHVRSLSIALAVALRKIAELERKTANVGDITC